MLGTLVLPGCSGLFLTSHGPQSCPGPAELGISEYLGPQNQYNHSTQYWVLTLAGEACKQDPSELLFASRFRGSPPRFPVPLSLAKAL